MIRKKPESFKPKPGTLQAWKFIYIERDPNKWDANVDNIMKDKAPAVEDQLNK